MQGKRNIMAVAAMTLALSGTLVAAGAPAGGAPLVLTRSASVVDGGCLAAGPYRPPATGSAGLPRGLTLCPSGPLTVSERGAVLDGWDVRGGIVVDATDVVVRRSRVTGDGRVPYGVRTTPRGSVRVEDTTLQGDFPVAAIGADRWTGERVEITAVTNDAARLGAGSRLRNSVVHVSGADGVVITGSGGDVLVEDNRIELGPGSGSAVRVSGDGESRGSVVVRGNMLGGGRWTVHEDVSGPVDVRISRNRFHPDAEQGPLRVSPGSVVVDNSYLDGRPVPLG